MAASAENQLSWEDEGLGHGIFTHFLIQGLKGKADANGDYKVTAEELYEYVREEVPKYVRKRFHAEQEPQLLGKGVGYVEVARGNMPPAASFVYSPEVPFPGKVVEFKDTSTDDGEIVGWSWDFGDGVRSSEPNPAHAYREPGTYTVTLEVTDDGGLTASIGAQVGVRGPGEVTAVDTEQGIVVISLGYLNGVEPGERFEVVHEIVLGDGTKVLEVRAVIEVVQVVSKERSACRIVNLLFPIEVKDSVYPQGWKG